MNFINRESKILHSVLGLHIYRKREHYIKRVTRGFFKISLKTYSIWHESEDEFLLTKAATVPLRTISLPLRICGWRQ